MLIWALILIYSCKRSPKTEEKNVEVNTAFEKIPPLAEYIQIKELQQPIADKNVLFAVRLDTHVVKNKYHAVMVNDEKLILRDDGKEGDEQMADGVFSIALKEDLQKFKEKIQQMQEKNLQALESGKTLFIWKNRSAVPISGQVIQQLDTSKISGLEGFIMKPNFGPIPVILPPDPALKDHSLIITELGVVEDPRRSFNPCTGIGRPIGAWTFGILMREMANTSVTGISTEHFIKAWLSQWMSDQKVNSDLIPARPGILEEIIKPWIIKTHPGMPPSQITDGNWQSFPMDPKFAPFKLLAIVNRLDLRGNSGYGISNAGEGRFVFGALNSTCDALKFTVIFEYGIPIITCTDLKAYAKQWYDLKNMTVGTISYDSALQRITDQFTLAGKGGDKPNGSCLNQVRTNELALGGPVWELREFVIDKSSHKLISATVKQEPAKKFNSQAIPTATTIDMIVLDDFVNPNEAAIKRNNYTVPEVFQNLAFLGGKAHTESPGHFWEGNITSGVPGHINNDTARHVISLNTCSGCHGGETNTSIGNLINNPSGIGHDPFLHMTPQPSGTATTLSAFLTGDPSDLQGLFRVSDPAKRPQSNAIVWGFNDLERRAEDLESFVNTNCTATLLGLIQVFTFKPLNMTH